MLLFLILIALLLSSTPIAIALALTGMTALVLYTDVPVNLIANQLYHSLDSFQLLAVPFFILAGRLMAEGQSSRRLIDLCAALTRPLRGGLTHAGVLSCAVFANISGSSSADLLAIGSVLIPGYREKGYDRRWTTGLLTSAGSLGILIPPSIPMIIYAHYADLSIARLFMAGFGPGILVVVLFLIYCTIKARQLGYPSDRWQVRELWTSFYAAFPVVLLPAFVLYGILGGIFTATEAAAVAALYSLFVELVVYRSLRLPKVVEAFWESSKMTVSILVIIAGAQLVTLYLVFARIPELVGDWMLASIHSPWIFLIVVNVFLLVLGCFLDIISAMLMLMPIFALFVIRLGIDPIHFAIIFILNMEIGLMTPPVGINLFVSTMLTGDSLTEVSKAVVPTVGLMLLVLVIVTFVPAVSLFLPQLLFGP